MIDDNKIEAAKEEIYEDRFLLNGEEIVFNNDEKEEMFYKEDIKQAIELGARWAINEFLKDLWHPASEEPKSNSNILIKIKAYKLVLYPEGKKEDICGYFYKVIEYDKKDKWKLTELEKEYQCNLKVIEWLYIDDLLPKEGGEQ